MQKSSPSFSSFYFFPSLFLSFSRYLTFLSRSDHVKLIHGLITQLMKEDKKGRRERRKETRSGRKLEPNERKEKVSHENEEEEGRQFFIISFIKDSLFLSFFLYFLRFLSFSSFFKRGRIREKEGERREWNEADADSAAGVMRTMRKLIRAWYWFNWTREIFFLFSFHSFSFSCFFLFPLLPFSFSFMNRKNLKEKKKERERREERDSKKLHLDFFFSRLDGNERMRMKRERMRGGWEERGWGWRGWIMIQGGEGAWNEK